MTLSAIKTQKGLSPIFIVLLVLLFIISGLLWFKIQKLSGSTSLLTEEEGVSLVYLKEVPYLKTGSEVCYETDLSCLGMRSIKIYDSENEFYGYVTPSCDSQIIKKSTCVEPFDTEYALDKIEYVKSPNSKSTETLGADYFCNFGEKGKEGLYEYAYCVKREL